MPETKTKLKPQRTPDFALEGSSLTQPADLDCLVEFGDFTIHIIPQAHIDLAWMWSRQDGRKMVLSTFLRHVEVLEKNPSYTFAQSQLAAYAMVERFDPALFARIQHLVKKGQWEIVGGQWVEPDNALPSGESHVRQFLFGQRYAKEKFGVTARVGWCPDSFTCQPDSLVDLMVQAGLNIFVFKRPREKFYSLPIEPFWWISPSGQKILALRSNNKGTGWPVLSEGTPGGLEQVGQAFSAVGIHQLWAPLGIGDIGGLNHYYKPGSARGWRQVYGLPSRYYNSLPKAALKGLTEYHGDMGPIMTGCLTTHVEMKALNRRAEATLQQAEFAVAALVLAGQDTEAFRADLRRAWEMVLFNQFHDVVTGCGSACVQAQAECDYRTAIDLAETVRAAAAWRLGRRIQGPKNPDVRVAVFNSLGWTRSARVVGKVDLGRTAEQVRHDDWFAIDDGGSTVPVDIEEIDCWQNKIFPVRLSFEAKALPAFGYKTFRLVHRPKRRIAPHRGWTFETDIYRVEFDPKNGWIRSLVSKKNKKLVLVGPLTAWRLCGEGKYFLDYNVEQRAWYLGPNGKEYSARLVHITQTPISGGHKVITVHQWGKSTFTQTFFIRRQSSRIDVHVAVDWQEVETLARLIFSVGSLGSEVRGWCDGPYRVAPLKTDLPEIPSYGEQPMHFFCAAAGLRGGLAVYNDGRYGCSFDGNELTVSVVRCATYPDPVSDQGPCEFCYGLELFQDSLTASKVLAKGYSFNVRPWLVQPEGEPERPTLPESHAFLKVRQSEVLTPVLKPAEDNDRTVVARCVNPTGRPQPLPLELPSKKRTRHTILEELQPGIPSANSTVDPYGLATVSIHSGEGCLP
ncbi:MAG: glycoside hydrolase family 38 C-terminal domain-containing protein [Phycisphaerae bacterium]